MLTVAVPRSLAISTIKAGAVKTANVGALWEPVAAPASPRTFEPSTLNDAPVAEK